MMLQVNLETPDQELCLQIVTHCSQFGEVKVIKLHRTPKPFALVEMVTNDQAVKLAAHYKRTPFDDCVLIYLEQKVRRGRGGSRKAK
jgi:RNA recognition motif. (a.k.a. RRM, RBD, or RNP domain)